MELAGELRASLQTFLAGPGENFHRRRPGAFSLAHVGTWDYWSRIRRHQQVGDLARYGYFHGVELQARRRSFI